MTPHLSFVSIVTSSMETLFVAKKASRKIHLAFSTSNREERERRRQGIRTKLQEQEDYRVEKIQKFCDG